MNKIDMTQVERVLSEVDQLIDELDGRSLDDRDALTASATTERHAKAKLSQNLQLLATRLELAAALVRVQYWSARGKADPLTSSD